MIDWYWLIDKRDIDYDVSVTLTDCTISVTRLTIWAWHWLQYELVTHFIVFTWHGLWFREHDSRYCIRWRESRFVRRISKNLKFSKLLAAITLVPLKWRDYHKFHFLIFFSFHLFQWCRILNAIQKLRAKISGVIPIGRNIPWTTGKLAISWGRKTRMKSVHPHPTRELLVNLLCCLQC